MKLYLVDYIITRHLGTESRDHRIQDYVVAMTAELAIGKITPKDYATWEVFSVTRITDKVVQ